MPSGINLGIGLLLALAALCIWIDADEILLTTILPSAFFGFAIGAAYQEIRADYLRPKLPLKPGEPPQK